MIKLSMVLVTIFLSGCFPVPTQQYETMAIEQSIVTVNYEVVCIDSIAYFYHDGVVSTVKYSRYNDKPQHCDVK